MSETAEILQLRFEGNGINPEKVKPSEIGELIAEFQNALLATIKQEYPEIDTDTVLFSLDGVRNESLGINFKAIAEKILPEVRQAVVACYILISTTINNNDYTNLNHSTVQSLKKISSFSKRYQCNGHFNRNGETLSTITPNTEIKEAKIPAIRSSVNIYGEIIDVGSNIHIRLDDGYNVIVDADKQTSKKLGSKLWEYVGLRGNAKWDIESLRISEFKLIEILEYNPTGISNAFKQLREVGISGWDMYNTNDDITKQLLRD